MTNKRVNISTGAKWEGIIGYSRAVKIGNIIEISGTTAVDNDVVVGAGSHYEQTRFILQKVEKVLKEAGASLNDVIRTRIFVADISKWEEVGKAHGEFFGDIRPATSMVQVGALISADLLVEIEVSAVVG